MDAGLISQVIIKLADNKSLILIVEDDTSGRNLMTVTMRFNNKLLTAQNADKVLTNSYWNRIQDVKNRIVKRDTFTAEDISL